MFHPASPARAALLLAVFLAAPSLAQEARTPHPDQASAEVPETRYTPPLGQRQPDAPTTTPDRHWVEANRTVSGYQPMMLTMPERPPAKEAPPAHAHGEKGRH